MARKVLVVGGAGYIGSFTVDELVRRGDSVTVFDNLSAGHRAAIHREARVIIGDLAHEEDLKRLFFEDHFDAVVHFAALTSVGDSVNAPLRYYRSNVSNSLRLLEAMSSAGVRRIVFSSSAATYGVPQGALDEDHPSAPINPYGRTKLMVEQILADAAHAGMLSAAALRYFNAAGGDDAGAFGEDHEPETHLIPLVLGAALGRRAAVRVMGTDYPTPDGTCVRDYIHVRDLADAHVRALDLLLQREEPGFQALNVGTGNGTSVREVIRAVESVTGKPVPFEDAPRRPGDPPVLVAVPEKIKRVLGWRPRYTDIREIVRTAYAFMESNPEGYR